MAARSTKTTALDLFALAANAPEGANWRAIAEQLATALATTPKRRTADDEGFLPWCEKNPAGKAHPFRAIVIEFADGEVVRAALSIPENGKAPNIARAIRSAVGFYRARVWRRACGRLLSGYSPFGHAIGGLDFFAGHVVVPEITAVYREDRPADRWSPAAANDHTADLRSGSWDFATVRAEAIAAGFRDVSDDEAPFDEVTASRWVRASFEEEALAELKRRGLSKFDRSDIPRLKAEAEARWKATQEPTPIVAAPAPTENVVPFRRPIAARTFARSLGSVAFTRHTLWVA